MARNVVKRDMVQIGARPAAPEPPAMMGGTSGEPADTAPRALRIAGIDDVAPMREHPNSPDVPVKRYKYIGTTGKVDPFSGAAVIMYQGQSSKMHVGKVVAENTVDVAWLRRQGLQFQEVDEAGIPVEIREMQAGAAE